MKEGGDCRPGPSGWRLTHRCWCPPALLERPGPTRQPPPPPVPLVRVEGVGGGGGWSQRLERGLGGGGNPHPPFPPEAPAAVNALLGAGLGFVRDWTVCNGLAHSPQTLWGDSRGPLDRARQRPPTGATPRAKAHGAPTARGDSGRSKARRRGPRRRMRHPPYRRPPHARGAYLPSSARGPRCRCDRYWNFVRDFVLTPKAFSLPETTLPFVDPKVPMPIIASISACGKRGRGG